MPDHGAHELKRRRVMVIKGIRCDPSVELGGVVRTLGAEVEDKVLVRVLGLEESVHRVDGVAVGGFHPLGGEAHGNHLRGDVCKVQRGPLKLVSLLLLADNRPQPLKRAPQYGIKHVPLPQDP
eukprot:CAMPEP_0172087070 /NCGR_PEP_ID=MMETSP1043-20130122/22479_1 /TAXON_ID=464988 /ORGANISM="Hemiselmis andersenii, Strain CCMP441" /LENGTH=122 /DNA_ID=CAMNT_0012749233 /DNA_START=225 /DNA_END=590 /DNA_ORIENTATION=+